MAINLTPVEDVKSFKQNLSEVNLNLTPVDGINLQEEVPDLKPIPDNLQLSQSDDPWTKMNKFQKFLDVLGRPGYAVKSAINDSQERIYEATAGIPENDHDARNAALAKMKPDLARTFDSAWKGFTGQERLSANELWDKHAGVKGVPLLGFATEVLVDPVTYTIGPAARAVGKGLAAGKEAITYIPGYQKAVTGIKEATAPVAEAVRELFINKTPIGKLAEMVDKHLLAREYQSGKEINYALKVQSVLNGIAKKTKQPIDRVNEQIVNLIENPTVVPQGVTTEARVLANTLKFHLGNILTKELKAGVPITELSKNARGIEYFPRITSKEAQQYLKQATVGNSKVWNPKIANALKRRTEDFTLAEFNDFVKQNGLASLGGKSVEQFFLKNPAPAVATRGVRSAKAISSANFLKEVGQTFGMTGPTPSYWKELPDSVVKAMPELKGTKFDPEVLGEVNKVYQRYINPLPATNAILKSIDAVQNTWKGWTTVIFPKFHIRNTAGNLWNNHLAGVTAPSYAKAAAMQMFRFHLNSGNPLETVALKQLQQMGIDRAQAIRIFTEAEKMGVLNKGWYAGDIERSIAENLKRPGVVEYGQKVGTSMENNARLAHFIDRIEKGVDPHGAAMSVKKYLFDYKDVTAFEREVMKRFMPFYTWSRKNIPLQLEGLMTQPEKYYPVMAALRERDPQDLLRLKYTRPDLFERLPVEFKRTIDSITYIPLEGIIPAADLTRMFRPQEMLFELLSPYAKTPIELGINKSFFNEQEIEKYEGQTSELLRMDLPVKFKYALTSLLPQARLLGEINKIVKKKNEEEELTPDEVAMQNTLTTIYKTGIDDLRQRALQKMKARVRELETGAFWAKRNLRESEVKRIKETFKRVKQEIQDVK